MLLFRVRIKVIRLSCYILKALWWFLIFNSKLRVGRNTRGIFTHGIPYGIFPKESCIVNPGSDTLIDSATNIIINKMTERFESNKILWVTDDKLSTHLLIRSKCIVIVVDTRSPFQNMSHSTSFIFSETNVINSQYRIEATTYQYF